MHSCSPHVLHRRKGVRELLVASQVLGYHRIAAEVRSGVRNACYRMLFLQNQRELPLLCATVVRTVQAIDRVSWCTVRNQWA